MNYETVIGLEIHAELKTKTKIFCSCSTKFGAKPNENTCPICTGMPGSLPVLNEEVVNLAIKAGSILGCNINKLNKMDRKNYFYPDLPKAYQTSQFDLPICSGGQVEFDYEGEKRKVRLNRIHIEEDAGKLVHLEDEDVSLIDYNRVGIPLAEIVTEPDIRSVCEAVAFMKKLKEILQFSGVSDCRMEQGSLRCDANISLREVGSSKLGTKVEIKNINSFRELQKSLEKEEQRQRELYNFNEGNKIIQETRRWDSAKGKTISMRSKEEAHDYRYVVEPDLPPIVIYDEQINNIKNIIPELAHDKRQRYINDYYIGENEVEILLSDIYISKFFEKTVKEGAEPRLSANWIIGELSRIIKENNSNFKDASIDVENFVSLLKYIEEGKISNNIGKVVLKEMFNTNEKVIDIIKEKGLIQINSNDELEVIIDEIIKCNPQSIKDFKMGKKKAVGYLMGQVMQKTHGKANPKVAKEILELKLEKE